MAVVRSTGGSLDLGSVYEVGAALWDEPFPCGI